MYCKSTSLTYFYTNNYENIKGCVTFCTLVDHNLRSSFSVRLHEILTLKFSMSSSGVQSDKRE